MRVNRSEGWHVTDHVSDPVAIIAAKEGDEDGIIACLECTGVDVQGCMIGKEERAEPF
jgi:hypothetical protein